MKELKYIEEFTRKYSDKQVQCIDGNWYVGSYSLQSYNYRALFEYLQEYDEKETERRLRLNIKQIAESKIIEL